LRFATAPPMGGAPAEGSPLLAGGGAFWREFITFCLAFGVNHGTVTVTLSLASSLIDSVLASRGNATLYITYGFTALFAAFGVVRALGAMRALAANMTLYFVYVLSYLLAVLVTSIDTPTIYVGGVLGGIAAGTLCTAQGIFFSRSTAVYMARIAAPGADKKEVTAKLAGTFAAIFLSFELALKLLSSLWLAINGTRTSEIIFMGLMSGLALLGAAPVWCLPEPPIAPDEKGRESVCTTLAAAATLNWRDPTILLLAPFNLSFGFMSALVNQLLNDELASDVLGTSSIGVLTSITVGVAALIALPLAGQRFANAKGMLVAAGACCFLVELALSGVLLSLLPHSATWWWWLVLVITYTLQGFGRAVFESVNKAFVVDLFPAESGPAFSNIIFYNSISAAFGFLAFPHMSHTAVILFCAAFAAITIPAIYLADRRARELVGAKLIAVDEQQGKPEGGGCLNCF